MLHSALLIAALSSLAIPFAFFVNPHPFMAILSPILCITPLWMVPIAGLSRVPLLFVAYVYVVKPPRRSQPKAPFQDTVKKIEVLPKVF
jgi:hypothetical protein